MGPTRLIFYVSIPHHVVVVCIRGIASNNPLCFLWNGRGRFTRGRIVPTSSSLAVAAPGGCTTSSPARGLPCARKCDDFDREHYRNEPAPGDVAYCFQHKAGFSDVRPFGRASGWALRTGSSGSPASPVTHGFSSEPLGPPNNPRSDVEPTSTTPGWRGLKDMLHFFSIPFSHL